MQPSIFWDVRCTILQTSEEGDGQEQNGTSEAANDFCCWVNPNSFFILK